LKKKNWKRRKIFFYKLKKVKKKKAKKIIFMKFALKRSTPKWTSNKMGNAKKGHAKVVATKRRASVFSDELLSDQRYIVLQHFKEHSNKLPDEFSMLFGFELVVADCTSIGLDFEAPGFCLKLVHFSNFLPLDPLSFTGILDLLHPACSTLDPFEPIHEKQILGR